MLGGERQQVRGLGSDRGGGHPRPVPRGGLDPGQHGRVAALGSLQLRRELEAVRRDDPVVVVAGHHQRRRVVAPFDDVVQGRVGQQRLEHLRVVGRAVVGHPGRTDRELVEAQHVQDSDGRQCHGSEVGALQHRRAHQQTAVAAAVDGEPAVGGDALLDEMVAHRGEVVEHVLLVVQAAGVVPGGAVLAAAAQVRDGQDTAG